VSEPGEHLLCICHCVTERAVREAVRKGRATVAALQQRTRAGTGCGSCLAVLADVAFSEATGLPLRLVQVGEEV
jgi:bacterioferritin-associated ferredoxin